MSKNASACKISMQWHRMTTVYTVQRNFCGETGKFDDKMTINIPKYRTWEILVGEIGEFGES